jgi:hypothetical protein
MDGCTGTVPHEATLRGVVDVGGRLHLYGHLPALGRSSVRMGLVAQYRDAVDVRSLPADHHRLRRSCARRLRDPVGAGGGADARPRGTRDPANGTDGVLSVVYQLLRTRTFRRADGFLRSLGRIAWSRVLAHDDRHGPGCVGRGGCCLHPRIRWIALSCCPRSGAPIQGLDHSRRASRGFPLMSRWRARLRPRSQGWPVLRQCRNA